MTKLLTLFNRKLVLNNLLKLRPGASLIYTKLNYSSKDLPEFSFRNETQLIQPNYKTKSYAIAKTNNLHLLSDTVGERIDAAAKTHPDRVAYKFSWTKTTFTFAEIKQRTDELAQSLLNLGFRKGDRLAVMLPNVPESTLTLLAAGSIGLIVVLMNPAYQLVEIEYMLKKTKAKGLVILDSFKTLQHYEIIKKISPDIDDSTKGELNLKNLPDLKHLVVVKNKLINDPNAQYKNTWSFEEFSKYSKAKQPLPKVDFDDPFAMLFTSGTTGFPKGAVLSHYNCINTSYFAQFRENLVYQSQIVGCPIPIFHVFGLITGVIGPFISGGKVVFPSFFPDTVSLMKAVHEEKIRSIKGAPIIFLDLINHPDRNKFDLSSLEYFLIGASTVPKTLLLKIKQELKLKHILVGLGLTESSACGLLTTLDDATENETQAYESVGKPFPFVECKIIDGEGQLAPLNTDGEICLRGFNIMKGYWDEPIKTAETVDANGWLKTGDIGSMNENGYVFFKSRAKEVIIRGGVNIYPAEVEAFLRTHSEIVDCYCFGYPDERVGEEVAIWIKLKPNTKNVSEETILDFCKGKIAYFKTPKYIKFVESFPINQNGKVQKFKMVEQMKIDLAKGKN